MMGKVEGQRSLKEDPLLREWMTTDNLTLLLLRLGGSDRMHFAFASTNLVAFPFFLRTIYATFPVRPVQRSHGRQQYERNNTILYNWRLIAVA
jgi:hypothetical protein